MRRIVLACALISMLWVPVTAADHVERTSQHEDRYLVVRGHADAGDGPRLAYDAGCDAINQYCNEPRYWSEATVSVWEETNECEGLQERQIDCDEDGDYESADTHVFSTGCASGGTDPCGQTALI